MVLAALNAGNRLTIVADRMTVMPGIYRLRAFTSVYIVLNSTPPKVKGSGKVIPYMDKR